MANKIKTMPAGDGPQGERPAERRWLLLLIACLPCTGLAQISASADSLAKMDRNGDGYLSAKELVVPPR